MKKNEGIPASTFLLASLLIRLWGRCIKREGHREFVDSPPNPVKKLKGARHPLIFLLYKLLNFLRSAFYDSADGVRTQAYFQHSLDVRD